MKTISTLATIALLTSCGTTAPKGGPADATKAWKDRIIALNQTLDVAPNLDGVTIPILRSSALEKKWGKPEIQKSDAGDYALFYKDPKHSFEFLIIYGSPTPFPKLDKAPDLSGIGFKDGNVTSVDTPQDWKTTTIAGQAVRWYNRNEGGGADGAVSSTEGFSLTDAQGRTGYYRVEFEENGNEENPEKRFETVGW